MKERGMMHDSSYGSKLFKDDGAMINAMWTFAGEGEVSGKEVIEP